ncbi:MAG: MMPL family transporter [Nitriliruptorales bacterium]|nr:MMPL family transporter [Nitriliruptorales bacterium]
MVLRWPIVIATVVFLFVAGALGSDVEESLISGGFEDPDAESTLAEQRLEDEFATGAPHAVVIATATDGDVTSEASTAAGLALTQELTEFEGVNEAGSFWVFRQFGGDQAAAPLKSEGGDRALILIRVDGDENEALDHGGAIREAYEGTNYDGLELAVTGFAPTFNQVNHVIEEDLVRAEVIALPVTLILLLIVFGSGVAAALPLGIGILSIIGTFWALELIGSLTDVSIFALNFTTAMGLGLAIDYSLLVVSRFREELAAGWDVNDAVRRTVSTAGRTVVFSAATVASSLVALLVFPMAFLRSFAYAGITVVALAAVGAVVVLPAILALIGPNVNKLKVRTPNPDVENGAWGRIARFVMRRPIPIATIAAIVLAAPAFYFFSNINLGFPDERVLYPEASTRQAGDILRAEFDSSEASSITIVAAAAGNPVERTDEIDAYATALSQVDEVARVDAVTGSYVNGEQVFGATPFHQARFAAETGATYLNVVPSTNIVPVSADGEVLVKDLRAVEQPFVVDIGGPPAQLVDAKASLFDRLPLALVLIGGITLLVLFLSFGSLLVPVKALILNLLSLTATFGALVWVFQDSSAWEDILGFTATGTLVMTMPVLMFITAFGLSMDYEVFLLSRIKEEHDKSGDNTEAVAVGLEHTGRIVTAAAVLIAVVFTSFAVTASVSFMIMFGLGMTLAVLVDAFIVRATLVPSLMRLAGEANWWAPPFLKKVYDRFGFKEHVVLEEPAAPPAPEAETEPMTEPV